MWNDHIETSQHTVLRSNACGFAVLDVRDRDCFTLLSDSNSSAIETDANWRGGCIELRIIEASSGNVVHAIAFGHAGDQPPHHQPSNRRISIWKQRRFKQVVPIYQQPFRQAPGPTNTT